MQTAAASQQRSVVGDQFRVAAAREKAVRVIIQQVRRMHDRFDKTAHPGRLVCAISPPPLPSSEPGV